MIPAWEAGKTYSPGALVRPASATAPTTSPVPNGGFESGTTSWDFPTGWSVQTDVVYSGTHSAKFLGNGISSLTNTSKFPVVPGQSITASVMVALDWIAAHQASGRILILWYNDANAVVSYNAGNLVDKSNNGAWQKSSVTAAAPAGATKASVGISAASADGGFPRFDEVTWTYVYQGDPTGLIFKAVQSNPGKSGSSEPVWPSVNGQTVVDNEVIWESVLASRLVWQASPLLMSGATEPTWPVSVGAYVQDGTINWETVTPRITDANCPNSKIVAIAASKVYAADDDIIRYCCTVNPLDWTTKEDAGYLPYGLQTYGSNPVAAMNLYRSNLAAFNAEGMQLWQVDEDPSQTALLDALPVGSTQNQALSPVANDLIFLSSQGVRSIGVTSSSTNLQAGDIGMPIDPLIKEAVAESPSAPIATYVPSLGQYWLAIADETTPGPTISGSLGDGKVGDVVDYHYVITATGGYTAAVISGGLPEGLSMDATGHVTGTRTLPGVFVPVIRVTDAAGRTVSKTDPSTTVAPGFDPNDVDLKYFLDNYPITQAYMGLGYDDSSWPESVMPLGTSNRPDAANYGFPPEIAINWPLNKACYLRGQFSLASPIDMKLSIYVDDAAGIFINGLFFKDFVSKGDGTPGNPFVYYFEDVIPSSFFVAGPNLISVICNGSLFGVNNYVDFRLEAV